MEGAACFGGAPAPPIESRPWLLRIAIAEARKANLLPVSKPHTVVYPWTMMIKVIYTSVTDLTVFTSGRFYCSARVT